MTALLTKDDRATEGIAAPTEADYRRIILRARERQLERTAENLQRLAGVYDRAAEAVMERVRALPDGAARSGTPWIQAQFDLLRGIDEELTTLKREYGDLLDLSMLSSAQMMADREAEVARMVGAPVPSNLLSEAARTVTLTSGVEASVQYGRLAARAVEVVANRYYRDRLKLSDRQDRLTEETKRLLEDAITEGIASGESARNIARRLEAELSIPRKRAELISQTEINNTFREAAIAATQEPDGRLKPYISALGWRLSQSHRETDRCDIYAAHDDGLGAGNYLPGDVPVSHPRCLCMVVSILTALPDFQFVRKQPDAAGVPVSEVRRLAEQGDAVAQRWMAGRVQ